MLLYQAVCDPIRRGGTVSVSDPFARRARGHHTNGVEDPAGTRFRFLCADNRLDMFTFVAEAQFLITIPRRRRRFQRLHKIRRRLDLACFGIEHQLHADGLVALESRRFAVTLPQRHARRPAHRRDCAAVGVTVQRDFHGRPNLTEDLAGIECQRDETDRTVANDGGLEGFRDHCRFLVHHSRQPARKASRFIRASRALVGRSLRIGAEWPCAIDRAVGGVRRDDLIRRLALLDPLLERGDHVERVRAFAAAAVAHAGRHEQPIARPAPCGAAERLRHAL